METLTGHRRSASLLIGGLCGAAWFAAGCAKPSLDVGSDDGGDRPGAPADSGAPCEEGATLGCECDGGAGTMTCRAGAYGPCAACVRQSSAPLLCVPGTYVGQATGTYNGGIPGVISGFQVATKNGLVFSLARNSQAGDEFAGVNSGCVRGLYADGGAVDTSSGGLITGSVDCSSGRFDGVLRNTYTAADALLRPVRVYQKGSIHAQYDANTRAFRGSWDEHEPANKLFGDVPGGGGTWSATLSDAGMLDAGAETTFKDCWGFDFPDNLFPDSGI
jgi:hypothetical protein